MSHECTYYNNDFVLYTSVLLVLVLIFPMLNFIILRVTWFYKDDLCSPQVFVQNTAKSSHYDKKDTSFFSRSLSSHSTRSHPIHPLSRTEATLLISESRDESIDTQRRLEDTIVYGKSQVKQLSIKGAQIETTSQYRRSAEDHGLVSKATDSQSTPVLQRHTAVRVESLPSIETPLRELSARRRPQKQSEATEGETFKNLHTELPEVTRVTPIMKLPALPPVPRTAYQSTEFIERLADTSVLYQNKYDVAYINSSTKLIETSSGELTPIQSERKLLSRPDNVRRKVPKLNTSIP